MSDRLTNEELEEIARASGPYLDADPIHALAVELQERRRASDPEARLRAFAERHPDVQANYKPFSENRNLEWVLDWGDGSAVGLSLSACLDQAEAAEREGKGAPDRG